MFNCCNQCKADYEENPHTERVYAETIAAIGRLMRCEIDNLRIDAVQMARASMRNYSDECAQSIDMLDRCTDRLIVHFIFNRHPELMQINSLCPYITTLYTAGATVENFIMRCDSPTRIGTILLLLMFNTVKLGPNWVPHAERITWPKLKPAVQSELGCIFAAKSRASQTRTIKIIFTKNK
jgi:hypothetical protein